MPRLFARLCMLVGASIYLVVGSRERVDMICAGAVQRGEPQGGHTGDKPR